MVLIGRDIASVWLLSGYGVSIQSALQIELVSDTGKKIGLCKYHCSRYLQLLTRAIPVIYVIIMTVHNQSHDHNGPTFLSERDSLSSINFH